VGAQFRGGIGVVDETWTAPAATPARSRRRRAGEVMLDPIARLAGNGTASSSPAPVLLFG